MKRLKNQGQSLIEVLTALAIAVLVIVALVAGVTYAVRNLTYAKNQALATQYAQEGLEAARRMRDEDPETFFQDGFCNADDPLGIFHRTRSCVYDSGNDWMDVTVVVSWNAEENMTTLETRLTNWR
ncbi:MAG: hypothetical protein MUP45_02780 [Candidatus Marinimicrobia bacterium]|nr:hypothetical protein [Candidatus Neomarinimicrobiota bacterium]